MEYRYIIELANTRNSKEIFYKEYIGEWTTDFNKMKQDAEHIKQTKYTNIQPPRGLCYKGCEYKLITEPFQKHIRRTKLLHRANYADININSEPYSYESKWYESLEELHHIEYPKYNKAYKAYHEHIKQHHLDSTIKSGIITILSITSDYNVAIPEFVYKTSIF
jgi:hypothetical protein